MPHLASPLRSPRARRIVRRWRGHLSAARTRLRSLLGRPGPPRVLFGDLRAEPPHIIEHPAIVAWAPGDADPEPLRTFLAGQTEGSVEVVAGGETIPAAASFQLVLDAPCRGPAPPIATELPAVHLEALLISAAAVPTPVVEGGWAPQGGLAPPATCPSRALLLALDPLSTAADERLVGRHLPHPTCRGVPDTSPIGSPSLEGGVERMREDLRPGALVRCRPAAVDRALAALPAVEGPRTALFLLPYLAVGGAEHLLLDLLQRLRERYRLLVATLDQHRSELGTTLDRCRELTPHVYTLGDWLPREARMSAVYHLLRRYRVESLLSWNGTVDFYDHLPELRRRFPKLRIGTQLFDHRKGWLDRYDRSTIAASTFHVAINGAIATVLTQARGVPQKQVVMIHHGVELPPPVEAAVLRQRRDERRREHGLPLDRPIVGTFVRLHPQKRPFDVLRLAERMGDIAVHFLLVGGGPLERAVDAALARRPRNNLTRLPMTEDPWPLFDAIDLCLLTSAYEGLPVFLLEGLARGLPCIAPAVGDVPHLLANGGGVVVPRPGDLERLQAAIEALLDPSTRAEEGSRGRATVAKRFGIERMARDYETVLFPGKGQ